MESVTDSHTQLDVLAVILDVKNMFENSGVYQSQVADQLIALRFMGYKVGVIAVSRDPVAFEYTVGKRFREKGVYVILLSDMGFIRNLFAMGGALHSLQRRKNIGISYVRGLWGPIVMAFANPWRRLPYVYDVRGALLDEMRTISSNRLKQFIYSRLEAWGIRHAFRVTAVTKALAEVVMKKHGLEEVAVVPSCIDFANIHVSEDVARLHRGDMGYEPTDIVLVYSGGLSHYQQVPSMLALWRRLLNDPDIFFLLLTNDNPHSMPSVVGDLSIFGQRLRQKILPKNDVPLTLSAADIGFMLRDTRKLNQTASPVKFAEYLAAGLAIVASPGTGEASVLVEKNSLGSLVDPANLEDAETAIRKLLALVRNNREAFRKRAIEVAVRKYDWYAHKNTFYQIYGLPISAEVHSNKR